MAPTKILQLFLSRCTDFQKRCTPVVMRSLENDCKNWCFMQFPGEYLCFLYPKREQKKTRLDDELYMQYKSPSE